MIHSPEFAVSSHAAGGLAFLRTCPLTAPDLTESSAAKIWGPKESVNNQMLVLMITKWNLYVVIYSPKNDAMVVRLTPQHECDSSSDSSLSDSSDSERYPVTVTTNSLNS